MKHAVLRKGRQLLGLNMGSIRNLLVLHLLSPLATRAALVSYIISNPDDVAN